MGVHDREYYREDYDPAPRLGAPTVLVSLIVANVVLYVLNFLLSNGDALTKSLSLQGDALYEPWRLYGLVTYGFVHDPGNIFHILFNLFILWVFGRDVQERFGQRVFLGFYLAAVVLAGVAWLAYQTFAGTTNSSAFGASGAVVATAVAYCTLWPKRELTFFGLIRFPAWTYASVLVVLDLLNAISDKVGEGDALTRIAWQAHLGGAAFGFAFAYFSPQFLPRLRGVTEFSPRRWWRSRRLRVYQEATDRAERDFERMESEADELLAKVKEFGEESLTTRERKLLEEYSRHVRQRRR